MEFMITLEVKIPPDIDEDLYKELMEKEAQRGAEMLRDGALKHMWRLPGGRETIAVMEAPDATALHELLMSAPLAPYVEYKTVQALADHPRTPAIKAAAAARDQARQTTRSE